MICSDAHADKITIYCADHQTYLCDECYISTHHDHNIKILESECAMLLSEYQKTFYSIKSASASCSQQLLEKDELLCSITSKINAAYDDAIAILNKSREESLKLIMNHNKIKAFQQICQEISNNKSVIYTKLENDLRKEIDTLKLCISEQRYMKAYKERKDALVDNIKLQLQSMQTKSFDVGIRNEIKKFQFTLKLTNESIKQNIIHNFDEKAVPSIYAYAFKNETNTLSIWNHQSSQQLKSSNKVYIPYHAVSCLLKDGVMFCGGDDDGYQNKCFKFEYSTALINTLDPLTTKRSCHALATDSYFKVYCVGGFNSVDQALNKVEAYDIIKGKWEAYPPMLKQRQYPACVIKNGILYSICSSNTNTIEYSQIYNENKNWQYLNVDVSMLPNLAYSGAVSGDDDSIYIFGGYAKESKGQSYVLNVQTRNIVKKSIISEPTCFGIYQCGIANDCIYAVSKESVLYVYSINKDLWKVCTK